MIDLIRKWADKFYVSRRGIADGVRATEITVGRRNVGYDPVLTDDSEDVLGRRYLASRLCRLLTDAPDDWSVRVALVGEWGEGKTTVAEWMRRRAETDGHLVAWFVPTASATTDEVWGSFAAAILNAADRQRSRIPPAATYGLRAFVTGWQTARRTREVAAFNSVAKTLHAAASKFLEIGPGHLKDVQRALGGKRVIVVIDDLDRADPRLLPSLLLTLRDVFDLPGYSFLLPFDELVVAEALSNYNSAWGDGRRFLDKIVDFRVAVPRATPEERGRLFERQRCLAASFVPAGVAASMGSHLPSNPRRLRAIVRGLSLMKEEAERHRPDDIDWQSALFGLMIADECESFLQPFVDDTFGTSGSAGEPRKNRELDRLMARDEGDRVEQERIKRLIERHASKGASHDRLLDLAEAWRTHVGISGSERAHYTARLLREATQGVTWADHDTVVKLYIERAAIGPVIDWINCEAVQRALDARDLSTTLVQALCAGYGRELEAVSHTMLVSEHSRMIDEAGLYIRLLREAGQQGLPGVDSEHVREQAFALLLNEVERWWHFRRNPGDERARNREQLILEEWLDSAGDRAQGYRTAIDARSSTFISDRSTSIRHTLLSRLAPQLDATALRYLETAGGVKALLRGEAPDAVLQTILNPASSLWHPRDGSRALQLLATAGVQPSMQENARHLLDLVLTSVQRQLAAGTADGVGALLTSDVLGSIWAAATATPIQFRHLKDLRDLRAAIVAGGAAEDLLPTPRWLEAT